MRRATQGAIAAAKPGDGGSGAREGCQLLAPSAFDGDRDRGEACFAPTINHVSKTDHFRHLPQIINVPMRFPIPAQVTAQPGAQATRSKGTAQIKIISCAKGETA